MNVAKMQAAIEQALNDPLVVGRIRHALEDSLLPTSPADYADTGGRHCPVCGSENLTGEALTVEAGQAVQDVSCGRCHATWVDVYNLGHYVDLERG